jgi:galactokinase/mevalonate kinase-like predicted kinase
MIIDADIGAVAVRKGGRRFLRGGGVRGGCVSQVASRERRHTFATQLLQCTAGVEDYSARTIAAMDRLKADAVAMKNALLLGDIIQMADILEDSWAARKLTAPGVSNDRIERLHKVAFANRALAGKVSGAGGGGLPDVHRPA